MEDLQARPVTCDAVSKLVCEDRIRSACKTLLFRWRFKQHLRKRKRESLRIVVSGHSIL
jgi:hypothetical protein